MNRNYIFAKMNRMKHIQFTKYIKKTKHEVTQLEQ